MAHPQRSQLLDQGRPLKTLCEMLTEGEINTTVDDHVGGYKRAVDAGLGVRISERPVRRMLTVEEEQRIWLRHRIFEWQLFYSLRREGERIARGFHCVGTNRLDR